MFKVKKIRIKLILLLFIVVFIFTTAILIFRGLEKERLYDLAKQHAKEKDNYVGRILSLKSSSLKNFAHDYTFYDEMVSFIKTKDQKWAKENIVTGLDTFKANFVWIFNFERSLIYTTGNLDLAGFKDISFPDALFDKLMNERQLITLFIETSQGFLEIVCATIHPSADVKRETTPKGFFLTGRLWNEEYIRELSSLFDGKITYQPYNGQDLSPVYDYENNLYIISKPLRDWQNNPVALLNIYISEDFLADSFRSFNFILISFITLSLLLVCILSFYISKWMIKPLTLLNESLKTEKTESLQSLKKQENEFSELSIMLERFFSQRLRLVEEILAHEEAEKVLAATQTRLKALFEFSPDAIYLTDLDGNIVDCNTSASEISGYSKDELLKMSISNLVSQENTYDINNDIIGLEVDFDEYLCKRKDGSIFPVELGSKRILINSEDFLIFIIREISEKKRLQKEKELLQKRQIESLGILAGGIAHDFNNLLTGIIGNLGLAKFYAKNDPKITQKLDLAEQVAMKAKLLTQQLLTFSKGGAPLKFTTSIKKILKESVEFLLSGSKINCNFHLPDDLWFVETDVGQLHQVINNIIINAIQAMPQGGTIEISADNINMSSSLKTPLNEGQYVRVSIKDSGCGISKENIDRIFEPYFTTKQNGTGLGLAVVYSIIKRHKGHIDVESRLGEGTTFTFYLPATQAKPEKSLSSKETIKINKTGRILIMDDDFVIREILKGFLEHLEYETECARDGLEAIDLYQKAMMSEKPFDLVIMDLTIPGGMGGAETIKELLKIDPNVKAIVSSGYSNDSVMAEYKEYGFKAAITKPFNIDSLKDALSIAMN